MSSKLLAARVRGVLRHASAKLVPAAKPNPRRLPGLLVALPLTLAAMVPSPAAQAPVGQEGKPRTPPMHERVGNPIELGGVRFFRDFDKALAEAGKSKKPVFLQFQEIPGCQTCRDFGTQVLSHPLLVEAIETLFVPVAVKNNTSGDRDEEILKRYEEPAWNNPVVRLVDGEGKDLVGRVSERWNVAAVASEMVHALRKAEQEVPQYLSLLAEEEVSRKRGLEHAVFAMHCFWEGEVGLGDVDGVIRTRAGWHDGKEVVEVWFDEKRVDYKTLLEKATARECASTVYWTNDAQKGLLGDRDAKAYAGEARADKEPKYRLRNTKLGHVPLTTLQQTKVNAAIGLRKDPMPSLSPRQLEMLALVKKHPKHDWPLLVEVDFDEAVKRFERANRKLSD